MHCYLWQAICIKKVFDQIAKCHILCNGCYYGKFNWMVWRALANYQTSGYPIWNYVIFPATFVSHQFVYFRQLKSITCSFIFWPIMHSGTLWLPLAWPLHCLLKQCHWQCWVTDSIENTTWRAGYNTIVYWWRVYIYTCCYLSLYWR